MAIYLVLLTRFYVPLDLKPQVVKFTVVGWGAELVVLLVGFAVMGTAYNFGVHFLALIVVVPIALFAFRKWIQGR